MTEVSEKQKRPCDEALLLRLALLCVFYGACWGSVIGTLACWQVRYGILF